MDSLRQRLHAWYMDNAGHVVSKEDSLDFAAFQIELASAHVDRNVPHPVKEYRLVWLEAREGHAYRLLRGDGRGLDMVLADPGGRRLHYFGPWVPSYHGGRYAVAGSSPPTGLPRFEYWYFERME